MQWLAKFVCLLILGTAITSASQVAEPQAQAQPDFSQFIDRESFRLQFADYAQRYTDTIESLDYYSSKYGVWSALNDYTYARLAFRGAILSYVRSNPDGQLPWLFYDQAIVESFGDERWGDIRGSLILIAQRNEDYRRWLQSELVAAYGEAGDDIISSRTMHWVLNLTVGAVDYADSAEMAERFVSNPPGDLRSMVHRHVVERKLEPRDLPNLAPILYTVYKDADETGLEEMYSILNDLGKVVDITGLILELQYVFGTSTP